MRAIATDQQANPLVVQQRRGLQQHFQSLLHAQISCIDGEEFFLGKAISFSKFTAPRRWFIAFQIDRVRKINELRLRNSFSRKVRSIPWVMPETRAACRYANASKA